MVENELILRKTCELCQAIVDQPEFQSLCQHIGDFQNNDDAKSQYLRLNGKRETLEGKQQQGIALTPEEIEDFEKQRKEFLENPVAVKFLEAQQEIQEVRKTVTQYVMKTFELARVPAPADLQTCGHGCSCH